MKKAVLKICFAELQGLRVLFRSEGVASRSLSVESISGRMAQDRQRPHNNRRLAEDRYLAALAIIKPCPV